MAKDSNPVIICAALTGAATMKNNNPRVPYTLQEFAEEAYKCRQAGAAMVHVHARTDDGQPTHEIDRIQAVYDAIKQKNPDLLVCLSSAVGIFKTPEQRLAQIVAVITLASLAASPDTMRCTSPIPPACRRRPAPRCRSAPSSPSPP